MTALERIRSAAVPVGRYAEAEVTMDTAERVRLLEELRAEGVAPRRRARLDYRPGRTAGAPHVEGPPRAIHPCAGPVSNYALWKLRAGALEEGPRVHSRRPTARYWDTSQLMPAEAYPALRRAVEGAGFELQEFNVWIREQPAPDIGRPTVERVAVYPSTTAGCFHAAYCRAER